MLTFLSSFISTFPSCQGFAVDTPGNTIVTNVTTGNNITIITTAYHLSQCVAMRNKERRSPDLLPLPGLEDRILLDFSLSVMVRVQ